MSYGILVDAVGCGGGGDSATTGGVGCGGGIVSADINEQTTSNANNPSNNPNNTGNTNFGVSNTSEMTAQSSTLAAAGVAASSDNKEDELNKSCGKKGTTLHAYMLCYVIQAHSSLLDDLLREQSIFNDDSSRSDDANGERVVQLSSRLLGRSAADRAHGRQESNLSQIRLLCSIQSSTTHSRKHTSIFICLFFNFNSH